MNVMKTICGDLKDADGHMVNMAQKTVKQRLAETYSTSKILSEKIQMAPKIQLSRDELSR
jgi:hypothetical protein